VRKEVENKREKRRRGSGEKDGQKGRERGGEIFISGKVQWTGVNGRLERSIGGGTTLT